MILSDPFVSPQEVFPMRVFVYGTLKRGEGNHIVMADARGRFVCEAKTKHFRRLVCNGLPYLHDGDDPSGYQVEGEVYEIPDPAGLSVLDRLEGNGHFYNRKPDSFVTEGGEELEAWVYYICNRREGEPQKRFTRRSSPMLYGVDYE